jgi:hypothetical protein
MILFATANNMIVVHSPSLRATDIKVKSLDYTLRIGTPEVIRDTLSVIAMPHAKAGKKMRLAIIDKRTEKTIKTITFLSNEVPAPVASVGNLHGAEAGREELLKQLSLKIYFPNSCYSYPYRIEQYTFFIQSAAGSATIPVTGAFLVPEVLEQIKNAPAGTTVTFKNIQATCPECGVRQLADISLRIK